MFGRVLERAATFRELLMQAPNPYASTTSKIINLTGALPYLTAIARTEVALDAATDEMSGAAATTAARMLIEEAARITWQGAVRTDEEAWERYVAVADGATQGRSLLRQRLADAGASPPALDALFNPLPGFGPLAIDTRRTPARMKAPRQARPFAQLLGLSEQFTEEGWLDLAFSLLSQVVHGTPLGDMHLMGRTRRTIGLEPRDDRARDRLRVPRRCDHPPTFAAVLDLSLGLDGHREWSSELAHAVVAVHNAAQPLHFLD